MLFALGTKEGTSPPLPIYTGPSVLKVLQSKDYQNWESAVDRYER